MRGEYKETRRTSWRPSGSPPHARGIQGIDEYAKRISGITPACAGNTSQAVRAYRGSWDHPRMRGEYTPVRLCPFYDVGSPPHARGIPELVKDDDAKPGITPACAGNTRHVKPSFPSAWDHPRMRGEYPWLLRPLYTALGSPPHARGIRVQSIQPITTKRDHPRMRGEY